MFKNILVPVSQGKGLQSLLSCASAIGRRWQSRLVCQLVSPLFMVELTHEDVSSSVFEALEAEEAERAARLKSRFKELMAAQKIPIVSDPNAPVDGLSAHWMDTATRNVQELAGRAQVYDIAIAERPFGDEANMRSTIVKTLLFESGRPILVTPPEPPKSIGTRIAIAWNGSSDSARTIAFAMPLLQEAEEIHVLSVKGFGVHGPSGADLANALKNQGLTVVTREIDGGRDDAGSLFLESAAKARCDMLLKGAYTHGAIHRFIFGGTTDHILKNAEIPVFMAH
ncbi:MAG: universal stress protein [Proteobacteria bacterium]|nr:universal stress protein [Pseudomonadota bacterium]